MAALADLAGSTAVVTGAGGGIGAELARQLAVAGLRVVLADIDEGAIRKQARAIADAGGECLPCRVDVSDPGATDALAAQIAEDFGPVRLLINNAGVELLGRCWEIPAARWERTMRVNVDGPFNMVRSFLPGMAVKGRPAFVANVCSIGSLISIPIQGAYVASKHALLSYTECLWLDVRDAGWPVKVSAVLPGPVRTGIFDLPDATVSHAGDDHRKQMQDMLAASGMPVAEAAERIIEGILSGRFWISTHPELLASSASQRAQRLAELADPATPAQ